MGYLHRIGMPPRTVQICIRCRQNPAGFWVSLQTTSVTAGPGACPAASTWTGTAAR